MSETLMAKLNELDAELVRFYGKAAASSTG
jgi:hypothetical protein